MLWGQPMLDLFASPLNSQLPMFYQRPQALHQSWAQWNCYVFPPQGSGGSGARASRSDSDSLWWPRAPWFPFVLDLLADLFIILPKIPVLLTQEMEPPGMIRRQDLQSLHLRAWRLNGEPSVRTAFPSWLFRLRLEPRDFPRGRCMTVVGQLMLSGVPTEGWLPCQPLFS